MQFHNYTFNFFILMLVWVWVADFFVFESLENNMVYSLNIYIHKHMYKVVRTNFLWVLNFGQVGGPNKKIQKHPLGWIFFKSS